MGSRLANSGPRSCSGSWTLSHGLARTLLAAQPQLQLNDAENRSYARRSADLRWMQIRCHAPVGLTSADSLMSLPTAFTDAPARPLLATARVAAVVNDRAPAAPVLWIQSARGPVCATSVAILVNASSAGSAA
jgi:hypothetical protein